MNWWMIVLIVVGYIFVGVLICTLINAAANYLLIWDCKTGPLQVIFWPFVVIVILSSGVIFGLRCVMVGIKRIIRRL